MTVLPTSFHLRFHVGPWTRFCTFLRHLLKVVRWERNILFICGIWERLRRFPFIDNLMIRVLIVVLANIAHVHMLTMLFLSLPLQLRFLFCTCQWCLSQTAIIWHRFFESSILLWEVRYASIGNKLLFAWACIEFHLSPFRRWILLWGGQGFHSGNAWLSRIFLCSFLIFIHFRYPIWCKRRLLLLTGMPWVEVTAWLMNALILQSRWKHWTVRCWHFLSWLCAFHHR